MTTGSPTSTTTLHIKTNNFISNKKRIKPHTKDHGITISKKIMINMKITISYKNVRDQEEAIIVNQLNNTMKDRNLKIHTKEKCNKLKKVYINRNLKWNFKIHLF
jgi:DUF4097 and DUF4098 domain-containing protein YvlB